MLRLLDVRPGQRVLDVGAGSGLTTACSGDPFDRVLVSAMARRLPAALVARLQDPTGVLVAQVGGRMLRVEQTAAGSVTTEHGAYRFVPLIEPT